MSLALLIYLLTTERAGSKVLVHFSEEVVGGAHKLCDMHDFVLGDEPEDQVLF